MLAPPQPSAGLENSSTATGTTTEVGDADTLEAGGSSSALQVPGGRRPTLLGSPMRSPLSGPVGWRNGDNIPAFSLDGDEAANLQAAIEASLGNDMKRRLTLSLQDTEQELCAEYPEDSADSESSQRAKRRRCISTDLDACISEAATSPKMSPSASPMVAPATAPRIVLKEVPGDDLGTSAPAMGPDCSADAQVAFQLQGLEYESLLDHETLLERLYAASGLDLYAQQERVTQLLAEINLRSLDLGVKNLDEDGKELVNQCFYLSIARSYLGHTPGLEEVQKVALLMKRAVEACVLQVHPEWAKDDRRLGENAMAFADFLPIAMAAKEPPNLAARLAVVVLDATQCCAEAYLGPLYASASRAQDNGGSASIAGECAGVDAFRSDDDAHQEVALERPREELERHLVLLVYTPGHYKALVRDDPCGSKPAWTYSEFKSILEERGVMCIETSDFD